MNKYKSKIYLYSSNMRGQHITPQIKTDKKYTSGLSQQIFIKTKWENIIFNNTHNAQTIEHITQHIKIYLNFYDEIKLL